MPWTLLTPLPEISEPVVTFTPQSGSFKASFAWETSIPCPIGTVYMQAGTPPTGNWSLYFSEPTHLLNRAEAFWSEHATEAFGSLAPNSSHSYRIVQPLPGGNVMGYSGTFTTPTS